MQKNYLSSEETLDELLTTETFEIARLKKKHRLAQFYTSSSESIGFFSFHERTFLPRFSN